MEKTTPYTFILCAKTRIGCGEPSINRLLTMEKRGMNTKQRLIFPHVKIFVDRPGIPHPPMIIESSINATSLLLSWRKDADYHYAPIRYTLIEYEEENFNSWKSYHHINKPDGQTTKLLIQK